MTMTKKWLITEPLEFEPLSVRSWASFTLLPFGNWSSTCFDHFNTSSLSHNDSALYGRVELYTKVFHYWVWNCSSSYMLTHQHMHMTFLPINICT
jgi:hypothetical protein